MEKKIAQPTYNIAVLGANGGIGQQAVAIALEQGHYVTAILRTPSKLTISHPNLIVVKGDIMQPDTLVKHLKHKDAVISAIGSNSLKETTLYSLGSKNLLEIMHKANVDRAFFISASGLSVNPSFNLITRLATKYILQPLLKNMYADLNRMEKIIKDSKINWTIMRPPKLTNGTMTGKYRYSINDYLRGGYRISRADVGHFMIHNIINEATYKKTIEIGY